MRFILSEEEYNQCYGKIPEYNMINGQTPVTIKVENNPIKVKFTLEHGETSIIVNHSGLYSLTCVGDYYLCQRIN